MRQGVAPEMGQPNRALGVRIEAHKLHPGEAALTRRSTTVAYDSLPCDSGSSAAGLLPVCPGRLRRSKSGPVRGRPQVVHRGSWWATDAWPIQACTVTTVKSLHRRARHNTATASPLLGMAERCGAIQ